MKTKTTPVFGGGGQHNVALPEYNYPLLIKQFMGLIPEAVKPECKFTWGLKNAWGFLSHKVSKSAGKEVSRTEVDKTIRLKVDKCNLEKSITSCHSEGEARRITKTSKITSKKRFFANAQNDEKEIVAESLRREYDKSDLVNKKKNLTNILTYSPTHFKKAFTLAEVLITLAIIGVVAALTMPALIAKHQEKQTVTRLKKLNSVFTQMFTQAKEDFGPLDTWGDLYSSEQYNGKIFYNNFKKYLKLNVDCGERTDCFSEDVYYNYKSGSCTQANFPKYPGIMKAVLMSGEVIYIHIVSGNCSTRYSEGSAQENLCGELAVDINGFNPPNLLGTDMFYFSITRNGIFPVGLPDTKYTDGDLYDMSFEKSCLVGDGNGCTAWVIYNENMDYLHCDDLSWNGKTKCK